MKKSEFADASLERCPMTAKRMIQLSPALASVFFSLISASATAQSTSQLFAAKVSPWTPEDILSAEYASRWNTPASVSSAAKSGRRASLLSR